MFNIAGEESYHHGEIIFKEGSSGDWVYVVQSGAVEISKTIHGHKYVIEVLEKGDIFGEVGFIGGMGRIATAQAVGETTIGIIDRDFLTSEFNKLSEDFRLILVAVAQRVKKMTDRATEYTVRKAPRVSKVLPVMFKFQDKVIKGYLGNMSTWGLFIRTDSPLNPGHKFSLKLDLPGIKETLKLRCEVVWSRSQPEGPHRPPGMGIKFRDIDMKDYRILKEYIKEQGVDE
ncbi:MAG: cyclic nucleotide-binding domain-containing protein, partial [Deltaproteobacteria bacterium]|nr:cyclic nucleotide-binding domain-containing protein [Deltaproteobacteria bacterium]